jgi:hypothetical protein
MAARYLTRAARRRSAEHLFPARPKCGLQSPLEQRLLGYPESRFVAGPGLPAAVERIVATDAWPNHS